MLAQNIAFGIVAALMVVAALKVVTTQNVVHAALYLVIVLAGVAAIYILLAAEFTAITQVIVYIGAVIVLFLFGIMLTRAPIGRTADLDNDQRWIAALVALPLLGVLGWTLQDAFGDTEIEFGRVQRTADVGTAIFRDFVIPFEVVSVLLLAALVGAVVIARRD
ncbi:MAG TPA: NADH-quinone oxidoreductase subunit J [Acidimicrobiales bacterium]|nr:NADH-quinone oxidoreductase subunit J [Acidimicrobiales bacterium]